MESRKLKRKQERLEKKKRKSLFYNKVKGKINIENAGQNRKTSTKFLTSNDGMYICLFVWF